MKYYQHFEVIGVLNTTTLDEGLVSLVEEPRTIIAVHIMTNEALDNVIEVWIGTERIMTYPDHLIDTNDDQASTNPQMSTTKINRIVLEHPVPAGQILKIGIRCGANPNNIYGAYEYEKTT